MIKQKAQAKEFYTVADVCEMFDVTPKTVHNWIAEGKLPGAFKASAGKTQPFLIPQQAIASLEEERDQS